MEPCFGRWGENSTAGRQHLEPAKLRRGAATKNLPHRVHANFIRECEKSSSCCRCAHPILTKTRCTREPSNRSGGSPHAHGWHPHAYWLLFPWSVCSLHPPPTWKLADESMTDVPRSACQYAHPPALSLSGCGDSPRSMASYTPRCSAVLG